MLAVRVVDRDRRAQWLRGVLDLCVLGLLARQESYGDRLAQSLGTAGLGAIQGDTLAVVTAARSRVRFVPLG